MIKTFKHRGLKQFFCHNNDRWLNKKQLKRITRLLDMLDCSQRPDDINLPSLNLHPLKGNRAGYWSIKVNANWRITFCFDKHDIVDVNLEDYH